MGGVFRGDCGTPLHVTHAFNVQRFHHRDCGLSNVAVLPALPKLPLFAGAVPPTLEVIGDCVHVNPLVLQLVVCCKPQGGACFITDSIAPPKVGHRMLYASRDAAVEEKDGKVAVYSTSAKDGGEVLIGSCIAILDAFRTALRTLGLSLQRAVDMCCCTPAAVADLSHVGSISPGKRADLVLLSSDLEVQKVFVNGSIVHDTDQDS